MLSLPPLPPPHPLVSPALLAFLARPSGLLGSAGLESLGAGTGVGLSPSGEGGREERMGEVGTIFEALGSLGGSSAQPICGELAFTLVLGTGGWGGGWDGG